MSRTDSSETVTAVRSAGENGFMDIVELLIDASPTLVVIAGSALTMVIRHDFSEVLEVLYDRLQSELSAADRLSLGGRLLHTAVEYDSPSSVVYLLSKGAPTNWMNESDENAESLSPNSTPTMRTC
ncbi:Ankyrin repeat domain-containing protein 50 [Phytophthora cinnamomi]|uniref:Ankyrin repeat domain-containing protein 50 n=1 Tax=Phytophthora cinnamomi TaxID=4785 RepID=UPI00355985DE|nr:Ankyrin repeat domain-containing protein 50 [Phytophthora cinnamomi]